MTLLELTQVGDESGKVYVALESVEFFHALDSHTVLHLSSGKRLHVTETPDDIRASVRRYFGRVDA